MLKKKNEEISKEIKNISADATIISLPPLITQSPSDLKEVSTNGTGSYKETRAQELSYINANAQISESQVTNLIPDLASKLNLNGSNSPMTGFLTLNSDPLTNLQAATKQYVDNSVSGAPYVLKAGDTMTGNLAINADLSIGTSTNFAPLTTQVGGGTTYSSSVAAYFGSVVGATGGNFYQISIAKGNYEAIISGINKDSTTGNIPANYAYFSTFSSGGGLAFAQGDNTGLPSAANLLINGSGQVAIPNSVTIGSLNFSSNALLNLTSSTQGMQPVTMTTAQMNAIPVTPQDAGLTVYVTDMVNGYYYFDGANWVYISNGGGGGGSLQSAYDIGNTIALNAGFPFSISTQSGVANFIWLYSPGAPTPYNYSSLEGMQFTPNVNVSVTALQYVNQYFSVGSRQVAIFRTSDQSLIVSDLVYKTDPLDSTGNYRTHSINPVTLYAGVSYLVVCIVPANENWTFYALSNHADFNYTGITYGQNASTIVYPSTIMSVPTSVYGNQNFQYSVTTTSSTFNTNGDFTIANGITSSLNLSPTSSNSFNIQFSISGPDSSGTNSPGIGCFTSADNYPLLQISPFSHGNISLNFDCYSASGNNYSSYSGSNFQISKSNNQLQFNFRSGISPGTGFSFQQAAFLTSAGNFNFLLGLSIGPTTTAIQKNSLTISGSDSSAKNASNFYTTLDQYPLLQIEPYSHNNVNVNFDCYYNGSNFLSSNTTSNFQISKNTNLTFNYSNGISQGGTITWGTSLFVSPIGQINLPNLSPSMYVATDPSNNLISINPPITEYVLVSGTSQQMVINTTYIITGTSPVTFTLPPTNAAIGQVTVCSYGNANWIVQTNAGQTIIDNGLSSTISATSSTVYDNATFIYAGNNSGIFQVVYQNGMQINLT